MLDAQIAISGARWARTGLLKVKTTVCSAPDCTVFVYVMVMSFRTESQEALERFLHELERSIVIVFGAPANPEM
jgi:hypothetical protein